MLKTSEFFTSMKRLSPKLPSPNVQVWNVCVRNSQVTGSESKLFGYKWTSLLQKRDHGISHNDKFTQYIFALTMDIFYIFFCC